MATVKKFYIGSARVYIEISPQLANTLDESLDNLNVKTIANDIDKPYAPFQRFYIKDENDNIIQTFIISADNVEVATQNPLRYIHNLSLVQESEFLTKHEIRNTVFSSAQDNKKIMILSATAYISQNLDGRTESVSPLIQRYVYGSNCFSYFKNPVIYSVDLEKKSILNINIQINFNIQRANDLSRYSSDTGNGSIYTDYEEPKTWSEVYENALSIPNYYPTIRFEIGADHLDLELSSTQYKNGQIIELPNNIMNFIKEHDSGTLDIYILNAPLNNTFMYAEYFTGEDLIDNPWMVNVSYKVSLFTLSKIYNIYSVIDTILKQQMKETEDYNSVNDSDHIKPLFLLPTLSHNPDLYNLLNETDVPNLIFTQSNMYDALVEIFKLFDGIFTIDNDGYLDIEYFNEQAQTPINEPKVAGKSQSLSEERFTNRLITYFQNTKIEHKFPNSNSEKATAYLRSKTMGVPNENDFVFITPKPIDIVLSAKIKVNVSFAFFTIMYSIATTDVNLGNPTELTPIDISSYIIEETLWTLLPNTVPPINNDWSINGKYNTLSYTRGNNYISVSEYQVTTEGLKNTILSYVLKSAIYTLWNIDENISINFLNFTNPGWRNVKLAVEYIALVDGKLVNESLDNKYEGETLINQSNGSIDINKLGLNMVGLGLKLGQPTLNMTQVFSKWDDRVRKGQYFVDDNGDRWVANNCVYTIIKPDLVQTNIEFVKNFNGLAQRIELNHEKRLSNISNELTVKCEETYGEYIYYSTTPFEAGDGEKIAFDYEFTADALLLTLGTFENSSDKLEYALITAYNSSNDVINLGMDNGNVENVAVPLMVYGSGNAVCFEMSFDSPISAGNQLLDNYTSSLWTGGWFSKAVLYCDTDGTADNFDIKFVRMDEELTRYYPEMKSDPNTLLSVTEFGKLSHFKYYKKPNEVFALNYQLHFMPLNKMKDFISNEFIKNNGFANGLNRKQLYLVTSTNANVYSILDTKGEGTTYLIDNIVSDIESENSGLKMKMVISATVTNWSDIKSWGIVDSNNNLYFSTNTAPSSDNSLDENEFAIYFLSRHHRLD